TGEELEIGLAAMAVLAGAAAVKECVGRVHQREGARCQLVVGGCRLGIGGIHAGQDVATARQVLDAQGHSDGARLRIDSAVQTGPLRVAGEMETAEQAHGPETVVWLVLRPARFAAGTAQGQVAGGEGVLWLLLFMGGPQVLERLVETL